MKISVSSLAYLIENTSGSEVSLGDLLFWSKFRSDTGISSREVLWFLSQRSEPTVEQVAIMEKWFGARSGYLSEGLQSESHPLSSSFITHEGRQGAAMGLQDRGPILSPSRQPEGREAFQEVAVQRYEVSAC